MKKHKHDGFWTSKDHIEDQGACTYNALDLLADVGEDIIVVEAPPCSDILGDLDSFDGLDDLPHVTMIAERNSPQPTPGFTRMQTIGGGQCAFGGFAQGLVDHALAERFEQQAETGAFQPFLNIFQEFSDCEANWPAFMRYLRANLEQPMELQRTVAKSLRKLLVHLREQQPVVTDGELEVLQGAFAVYVRQALGLPNAERGFRGDDIYSRHQFMMNKIQQIFTDNFSDFEKAALKEIFTIPSKDLTSDQSELLEIYNNVLAAAQSELLEWYKEQGSAQFTRAMSDDTAYAGDLELKILAKFWGVSFKVERTQNGDKFIHTICVNYGHIKAADFTDEEIRMLKNFGIVDRATEIDGYLSFTENQREVVVSRLADIVQAEQLMGFWESWKENRNLTADLRSALELSEDFSEGDIAELLARDLLVRSKGKLYFPVEVSDEEFRIRLRPFTVNSRQRILKLWDDNYRPAPEIRCANDNAIHWEYLQPDGSLWTALVPVQPPTMESMSSLLRAGARSEGSNSYAPNWQQIQKDAHDLIINLNEGMPCLTQFEQAFFEKVCQKLYAIVQDGVVTKENALCLLAPKRAFKLANAGKKMGLSDNFSELCMFRDLHYFPVLAATYEQLIDNYSAAGESLKYIVDQLNQNGQQELANGIKSYTAVIQAIEDSFGEQYPLVEHLQIFEDADFSGHGALNQEHLGAFCNQAYQQHLNIIRNFISHLRGVIHACKLSKIAEAIAFEMLDHKFENEYLEGFLSKIRDNADGLEFSDEVMMDSLDSIITTLDEDPVLQENLRMFMQRVHDTLTVMREKQFAYGP